MSILQGCHLREVPLYLISPKEAKEQEEEEELVDYQEVLKEKCAALPGCSKLQEELESCNDRVSSRSNTTEECSQELFDFIHCVDHCVSR